MKPDLASDSDGRVKLASVPDFDLGGMHVSPARREVRANGETRMLEPRVMQVLVTLAEARPSVVARDELVASCWPGTAVSEDAINRCILALRKLSRETEPQPFTIETVSRVGYALQEGQPEGGAGQNGKISVRFLRKGLALPVLVLLLALAAGAFIIWQQPQSDAVSVAVVPATSSAESRALAEGLTTKLGTMQIVSEARARLLDVARAKDAQLRFSVRASPQGSGMPTNVVLLNKRAELLWSKDFQSPPAHSGALEDQIAYAAGKVLECDIESQAGEPKLNAQLAKLYLNGCASLVDANESSIRDLSRLFEQITRSAPGFQPAWRKALMLETTILDWYDRTDADKQNAREFAQAAAKLNPSLPELDVLKSALLPTNDISGRMNLVKGAYNRAPADGPIGDYYAVLLIRTGRLYEGVTAARKAVRADPLAPAYRGTLIMSLATAGRIAEAQEELRQAEALWPDSAALKEVHYTLSLRFTDPRMAIRLRDSGQVMPSSAPWQGSFLAARAERTPANVERALRDSRAMYASDWRWISHTAQTFGEFGRDDELFAILLNWDRPDSADFVTDVIFRPPLHNFRRDPRFLRVAQRLGLLEYWRSSGKWPDFCSESDLPYDCKREAAKL